MIEELQNKNRTLSFILSEKSVTEKVRRFIQTLDIPPGMKKKLYKAGGNYTVTLKGRNKDVRSVMIRIKQYAMQAS